MSRRLSVVCRQAETWTLFRPSTGVKCVSFFGPCRLSTSTDPKSGRVRDRVVLSVKPVQGIREYGSLRGHTLLLSI